MIKNTQKLAGEFPELSAEISRLAISSEYFARAIEEYEYLSQQVDRIEQEIDKVSHILAEKFKKRRIALKDEILGQIRRAA